MGKAHFQRFLFEVIKFSWADITLYRQVMTAWLQILAQRQHRYTVIAQILHHLQNLFVSFTEPHHQA